VSNPVYRNTHTLIYGECELIGQCKIQGAKLGAPVIDGYVMKTSTGILVVIRAKRFEQEWVKVR
jgi:hypothetical protein